MELQGKTQKEKETVTPPTGNKSYGVGNLSGKFLQKIRAERDNAKVAQVEVRRKLSSAAVSSTLRRGSQVSSVGAW